MSCTDLYEQDSDISDTLYEIQRDREIIMTYSELCAKNVKYYQQRLANIRFGFFGALPEAKEWLRVNLKMISFWRNELRTNI